MWFWAKKTWSSAKINFQHAGATILTIPTDENGIMVDALEENLPKTDRQIDLYHFAPRLPNNCNP